MPRPTKKPAYKRNYGKKNNKFKRKTGPLLKIQRPLSNRQPRSVHMNLVKDFQVYIDPANSTNALQNGVVITMAVNSLYPFLEDSGTGFHSIQKMIKRKLTLSHL